MPRNPDIWRDTEVLEAWRSIEGLGCVTCVSFIYLSLPFFQFQIKVNKVVEARFPTLPTVHTSTVLIEKSLQRISSGGGL